jgi:hypothetical protein
LFRWLLDPLSVEALVVDRDHLVLFAVTTSLSHELAVALDVERGASLSVLLSSFTLTTTDTFFAFTAGSFAPCHQRGLSTR